MNVVLLILYPTQFANHVFWVNMGMPYHYLLFCIPCASGMYADTRGLTLCKDCLREGIDLGYLARGSRTVQKQTVT